MMNDEFYYLFIILYNITTIEKPRFLFYLITINNLNGKKPKYVYLPFYI